MKIYKATLKDIDSLIQLRIDFLKEDLGQLSAIDETTIRQQIRPYYNKYLPLGDFIALIAKEDEEIISTAFMVIEERPANPMFISGLIGVVINVYTYPKYRRKGYAINILKALIGEAEQAGISAIDLHASSDGLHLYKRLGFSIHPYTPMRLKLL